MTVWVFKEIPLNLKIDQNMYQRPLKNDLLKLERFTNRIRSSISLGSRL